MSLLPSISSRQITHSSSLDSTSTSSVKKINKQKRILFRSQNQVKMVKNWYYTVVIYTWPRQAQDKMKLKGQIK